MLMSLFCNLGSHPRFVFPDKLDPNFFGFPSSSAEDYQSHFKNINPGL